MSTDSEIREVYEEDLKRPFYTLQRGTTRKRKPRRFIRYPDTIGRTVRLHGQTNPDWFWGHLRDALLKAGIK